MRLGSVAFHSAIISLVIPSLKSCVFAGELAVVVRSVANLFGVSCIRCGAWMSEDGVILPPKADLMYIVSLMDASWWGVMFSAMYTGISCSHVSGKSPPVPFQKDRPHCLI